MDLTNSNPARTRILLYAQQRRETLEYLKFVASIKAQILDRSQADEITSFNELLADIHEFYFEGSKKPKKTWQDQAKVLEDFQKFKGSKLKIKNFAKVKEWPKPLTTK